MLAESIFLEVCRLKLSVSAKQYDDKKVIENNIRFMKLKLLDKSNNYFSNTKHQEKYR
jgi:hypothetical protein